MSFDDELLKHVPTELRDEFPREQKPKRAESKPQQPRPQAKQPEPVPSAYQEKLIEAHALWQMAGSPAEGQDADRLIESLVNAYLVSEDGSPFEQEVVYFAQNIGALDVLSAGVEAYNAHVETEETKDQYRADAFKVFQGLDQSVVDGVGEMLTPELLEAIRDGGIEPDELRQDLAARIETVREVLTKEGKREELQRLDEALVREGSPVLDEQAQRTLEHDLRQSTAKETRVDVDRATKRALVRSGEAQLAPKGISEEAFDEAARAIGAYPIPEVEERRERLASGEEGEQAGEPSDEGT